MKRSLVSRPYRHYELPVLYDQLQIGDLLEFRRRGFSHWAIYIGEEFYEGQKHHCVIHRSLPPENEDNHAKCLLKLTSRSIRSCESVSDDRIGSIQIDSIEAALGRDPADVVAINNELDRRWQPFPPEEIIARARRLMYLDADNLDPYNLVTNNCEHFATRCRYGIKYSRQIRKGIAKVATTVASVATSMICRSVWRAAMPAVLAAAAAAGVTVGPVALATMTVVPTIAGVVASAAPSVAHAIESHRGRRAITDA